LPGPGEFHLSGGRRAFGYREKKGRIESGEQKNRKNPHKIFQQRGPFELATPRAKAVGHAAQVLVQGGKDLAPEKLIRG